MIEIRNTANNGFVYLLNGNWHRSNGPARVWANGDWGWYLNDRQHRYYGPQANNEWWIHGECIKYGFE
jgi:hypothetical protein